jgi:perosamine synthetase
VTEAIPLARPVIGEREEQLVLAVLRSGRLSLGPLLERFERRFSAAVGAGQASAVSSGTAGLHLGLRAVGVGRGDEVITSPFSFVASANVALFEGARPVFADIDPVTLNLDPAAAQAAIGPRTAAVLPVHVFGYPADIAALERLDLPIVEDACEALGAAYADGTPVGSGRHPAVFAFYANKQMTTGEGGAVTTPDPAVKERMDSERNQGRAPDMGWLDHDRLGFNYRLSDIACALGLAQLERLEELLRARASVAALYREALSGIEGLQLPCPDQGAVRRGWFVYVVQLPREVDRDDTVRELGHRGVSSKPYFPAIHLTSYYRDTFGYQEGQFPVCEDVASRSIALPFFPQMSQGQVERVAEALGQALGR